jgi:hypothetical protein
MIRKHIQLLFVLTAALLLGCASPKYSSWWSPNVDLGPEIEAVKLDLETGCPIVLTPQATLQNPTGQKFVFELRFSGTGNSPAFSITSSGMNQNQKGEVLTVPNGELPVADLLEFIRNNQSASVSSGPGTDYWLNGRGRLVIEGADGSSQWWIKLAQPVQD